MPRCWPRPCPPCPLWTCGSFMACGLRTEMIVPTGNVQSGVGKRGKGGCVRGCARCKHTLTHTLTSLLPHRAFSKDTTVHTHTKGGLLRVYPCSPFPPSHDTTHAQGLLSFARACSRMRLLRAASSASSSAMACNRSGSTSRVLSLVTDALRTCGAASGARDRGPGQPVVHATGGWDVRACAVHVQAMLC